MKILGQEYTIKTNEDLAKRGLDGETDLYGHEIFVRPLTGMLEEGASYANKTARYEESLRHEIVHAFFFESGLPHYAYDETLVEWIADIFPKMQSAFKEAGCDGRKQQDATLIKKWQDYLDREWEKATTSTHEANDTYRVIESNDSGKME